MHDNTWMDSSIAEISSLDHRIWSIPRLFLTKPIEQSEPTESGLFETSTSSRQSFRGLQTKRGWKSVFSSKPGQPAPISTTRWG